MAVINHEAELARAGAHVNSTWGQIAFLARRYPLGAVGFTIVGIEAAFLVGGLIVTETVFNIPGVARFLVEAIRWRDYPIVQNLVMLIAFVVVTVNFLVDMAYMVLDPRIKFAD